MGLNGKRGTTFVEYLVVAGVVALASIGVFRKLSEHVGTASHRQGERVVRLEGAAVTGAFQRVSFRGGSSSGESPSFHGSSSGEPARLSDTPPLHGGAILPSSAPSNGTVVNDGAMSMINAGRPEVARPTLARLPVSKGWQSQAVTEAVRDLWIDLARVDPTNVKPSDGSAIPYGYESSSSMENVNTDFYGAEVALPANTTPEQWLLELQNDVTAFTKSSPDFTNEVTWPGSPGGKTRKPGDIVHLTVRPSKNAPIMYLQTVDGKKGGPSSFGVVTVTTDTGYDNVHPVKGFRYWGITPTDRGTYVIWTAGIDGPTYMGTNSFLWMKGGAALQDRTWTGFVTGVSSGIRKRGGGVLYEFHKAIVAQPAGVTAKSFATQVRAKPLETVKTPSN